MSYTNSDETTAEEPTEIIDWSPDEQDAAELGHDLGATCATLVEEMGVTGGESYQGISVGMMVQQAIPKIQNYAAQNPQTGIQAVARMYLESRALLDKHAPETDPEDLL